MKKITLLSLFTMVMLVILVACGDNGATTNGANDAEKLLFTATRKNLNSR